MTRRLDDRSSQAFVEWNTEEDDKENDSANRQQVMNLTMRLRFWTKKKRIVSEDTNKPPESQRQTSLQALWPLLIGTTLLTMNV